MQSQQHSEYSSSELLSVNSIQALLSAPNPDDPLAENVARHWKDNEFEAVATGELRSGYILFYKCS